MDFPLIPPSSYGDPIYGTRSRPENESPETSSGFLAFAFNKTCTASVWPPSQAAWMGVLPLMPFSSTSALAWRQDQMALPGLTYKNAIFCEFYGIVVCFGGF